MREELDIPMPAMGPSYRVSRRRPGLDPNTKRLLMIAGGIGGALLVIVGGWSMTGRHHGGVPVVEADSRPLKVKPENPGGLQVAGQDESIMGSGAGGDSQTAALAPAPEVPAPQALKAQERTMAAARAAAAAASAPAPAPVSTPAPAVAATAMQSAETPHPAARPVPAEVRPAAVETRPAPMARPAPAMRTGIAEAAHADSGHGALVQLAAVGSAEAAMAEWQRLAKRNPELLAGRKPVVMKTERDGKQFWRLRTGGFTDAAQAGSFCERMKSKGTGCSVASF